MSSNIPQRIPHPTIRRISVTLNSANTAVLMSNVSVFFLSVQQPKPDKHQNILNGHNVYVKLYVEIRAYGRAFQQIRLILQHREHLNHR